MECRRWVSFSTKQGRVYICTAVPLIHLIVLAMMFATFDPLIDALNGVLMHDTQPLMLALHLHR